MDSMDMSLSQLREMVKDWRAAVHGVAGLDTTEPLNTTTARFKPGLLSRILLPGKHGPLGGSAQSLGGDCVPPPAG